MKNNKLTDSLQLVIFGASGDLSQTKLIPSLYKLFKRGRLPEEFFLLGADHHFENRAEFLRNLSETVREILPETFETALWEKFAKKLNYLQIDFEDEAGYKELSRKLDKKEKSYRSSRQRIYYLATAPGFFPLITEKLDNSDLAGSDGADWPRLVIEKPFGYDLESAVEFNRKIYRVFPEDNIYRIDHYLGKEMIQNILTMRFANMIFEPIWNKNYIDNIQIISTEKQGIKSRGKYYDKSGALRDMIQSHLLQMLALIAMEPPENMATESILQEKIKLLKSLAETPLLNLEDNLVLGQYSKLERPEKYIPGYQEEDKIKPDSSTETFAAVKFNINNLRWRGVPIYLKTGKRLEKKNTKIFIQFKSDFHPSFLDNNEPEANLLIIKVQPREGVSLQFNAKKPGSQNEIVPVFMDFCHKAPRDLQSTPEAYEELLAALIRGDQSLFTHWKEVKNSWLFIDQLREFIDTREIKPEKYLPGSSGPESMTRLVARDHRQWWDDAALEEQEENL